jgi:thiamine biosynthesis lipoprotein
MLLAMRYFSERFEAIGVTNQVTVFDEAALASALSIARREVQALDDACSRFRTDSELARLNREGNGTASPLLMTALDAALACAEATDGLVDPTVGASMRALGYDRDFDLIATAEAGAAFSLRPTSGWRAVRVDRPTRNVTIPAGCELDLGATAKAFAADRIATAVHALTGSSVLISLGGDIAVAGAAPRDGWPILVTDSSRAREADGQVVAVSTGGLATSSTTVRRWRAGQVEVHHIIDPRTGACADVWWRTVSVAAASCLDANSAATAALVLGPRAPRWLESRNLSARLVHADGSIQTTVGWPADPLPSTSSEPELEELAHEARHH